MLGLAPQPQEVLVSVPFPSSYKLYRFSQMQHCICISCSAGGPLRTHVSLAVFISMF